MRNIVIGIIVLLVLVAGYFIVRPKAIPQLQLQRYSNTTYGIAFRYPAGYTLSEREVGTAERGHYAISLVRGENNQMPVNGEGPAGITIDIYQNKLDKQTIESWLRNVSSSNFKLGDGTFSTTTVSGVPGILYRWSGLFEGITTAFTHGDTIVAASVTFITPQDEQVNAYSQLMDTIELSTPQKK